MRNAKHLPLVATASKQANGAADAGTGRAGNKRDTGSRTRPGLGARNSNGVRQNTATDLDILRILESLVEPLSRVIPGPSEVVLHDLSKLPLSISAVGGQLTNRKVGGAATDMLLRAVATEQLETMIGYETTLADGRRVKSTTMVVRNASNEPIAALCVNADVTHWESLRALAESMLAPSGSVDSRVVKETFVTEVDELSRQMLTEAIATVPVPVALMRKEHKLAVVNELKSKGFFMFKESVETAAKALQVTRFSIYNYLNELTQNDGG